MPCAVHLGRLHELVWQANIELSEQEYRGHAKPTGQNKRRQVVVKADLIKENKARNDGCLRGDHHRAQEKGKYHLAAFEVDLRKGVSCQRGDDKLSAGAKDDDRERIKKDPGQIDRLIGPDCHIVLPFPNAGQPVLGKDLVG